MSLICIALLVGCSSSEQQPGVPPKQDDPVQFAKVTVQTVQNKVSIPAKVQADPDRVVHIYPPVSGRLVSLNIRPGDEVKKGQELAIIESSDAAGALSDYEKARIEADRASQAEKRAALLLQHEVMAQKDYEDIKAQAEMAKSDLARTQQRLRMLGLRPNSSTDQIALKAPRPGVVLDIGAANGELSKSLDNASSIATIADLSSVWIVGDLYETDLSLARRGTPAKVTVPALPDSTWHGVISNVSDFVDPATRTLKARIVLPNPGYKLKPEMFAIIQVVGRKQEIINVPTRAVLHDGSSVFVMVKKGDGSYEKRQVTIANSQSDITEIVSGLQPGETIVISGAELLRNDGAGS